eukprot:TRINITY_DN2301_c0_g1_i1.p1 TRINITY_DN2301_c0_g1~~TRINITY_DN2301_c0_g1_i1.p1  ORF type:complete len:246 (+),score=37.61 TRINITY_DN2301_c0_g1_i1:141-878(+)
MDFLKVKQEEMVELEAPQQMGLPNKLCNFGQVKLPALPQLLGGLAHISPIVTPWTLFPQQGLLSSQMIVPCLPNRFGSHISLPQMNPVAQPNAISFKFMFKNTGELKSQKDIKPDLPVPLDESQRRRKGEAKAEEDKNLQVRITPISEAGLLSFIYPMQSKFQYELKPLTSIPSEMYKDRNVSFKVELRRTDGEKVTNSALITVRLKLFTVENPPKEIKVNNDGCLLYTSPSPRDRQKSRMPSSA